MSKSDFDSILKKFCSLLGKEEPSKKKDESKNPSQEREEAEGKTLSNFDINDGFLPQDHFLRSPLQMAQSTSDQGEGDYEHRMLHNLFAAVEGDEFSHKAVKDSEPLFKDSEPNMDLLAVDFAKRLYKYELDLRQNYNPDLGMYPSQGLYTPTTKPKTQKRPPDGPQ